jgi:hypothetical protein
MHDALKGISDRILDNALGALMQANTTAVFHDPGMEHREQMSILSAALAGELFLKAIIASEHPLLIFKDLFHLDQPRNDIFDIEEIIRSGRTYGFEHLPRLLWVSTGERVADPENYDAVRVARNSVQHFCSPGNTRLRELSLQFIYRNIDPLINKHFGICAIEYHEDHVGYDHVVACLIAHELEFSIPIGFGITEIDLYARVAETSLSYKNGFGAKLLASVSGN